MEFRKCSINGIIYNDIKNDTQNKIYNAGDVFSIIYCLIAALLYLSWV